jgi:hypothetical protein
MIIFDLDGTLAYCEHRRHFVDPKKNPNVIEEVYYSQGDLHRKYYFLSNDPLKKLGKPWKPDWKAFYEACYQDTPIYQVINLIRTLWIKEGEEVEIWSGRCESVRSKTGYWINTHIFPYEQGDVPKLKMRPIGDSTPDDQLKERWLDEAIAEGKTIDMVFDDRSKVVKMYQRRGIFVFDISQGKGDF